SSPSPAVTTGVENTVPIDAFTAPGCHGSAEGPVTTTAAGLREAGIDYVIASWPAEGKPRVEEFWAEVAPELTG
ncbi:MAG TPA: hypothetical protein VEU29_00970, partial [Actinomycetota bacterium]|nr:hypothetical protein [Actinomycetota bacterium]